MKKKILFINTRLIYPSTGGRKVVLYNYCKGIKEIYNYDIDILTFLDAGDEKYIDKQPDFVNISAILNQPSFIEKAYNIVFRSLISRKWPIQVSLYYSRENQKKIDKYIKEEKPDIIICDMARTAQYVVNGMENNCKKILDMDDLISIRYKRQLESSQIGSDAIGAYIQKIPKIFRGVLNVKKLMKYILRLECILLEKYELYLKDYFNKYIFVSPVETKIYNDICNFDKADYVTIGVDYNYYSSSIDVKRNREIVFLGNLNIAHNKKSVEFFINNIYPIIKKKDSTIIFKIVGKCDNLQYAEELQKNKGVYVTGEVDDIRPYIKSSMASIAYLTYGSGIKTKILETMAMGVPVVTNSIGAEGIIDNDALIVEDNIKIVADQLFKLINDINYNKEISEKGKKFIEENYQWKNILRRFTNIL